MELKEALERLDHNILEADQEAWMATKTAFVGTQQLLAHTLVILSKTWTNGLAVGVIATSLIIFLVTLIF